MDRQELDGGDAEVEQVADGRLGSQSGVGAAERLGDLGMPLRETLDVDLVDEGLVPRGMRRAIVAPGEGRVDDLRQRGEGGAVALVEGEVRLRIAHLVAEQGI